MRIIPYGRQYIDNSDLDEVAKVLKSDWITQGPKIKEFENSLSRYCQSRYAVAVSSGTAALHLACLVASLKKGQQAITTPISFLATANSILYAGARPVFADIDYDSVNIDPRQIRRKITKNTRAILPLHFGGLACDMKEIAAIAKRNGLMVIEDACHALGAEYRYNRKWVRVGSCTHSDMTAFSFHPVKHITTGEGGAITTNNRSLYQRLLALRSHGVYRSEAMTSRYGRWYYQMKELGFNYRITDFQCALGLSQLKRVDSFIARRRKIAEIYNRAFEGIDNIEIPPSPVDKKHSYHLYILKIDFARFKLNRKRFVDRLRKHGLLTQVHYIPIYRQPYYRKLYSVDEKEFPGAEAYYKKAVSIPIYPGMSNYEIRTVIDRIKELLDE